MLNTSRERVPLCEKVRKIDLVGVMMFIFSAVFNALVKVSLPY